MSMIDALAARGIMPDQTIEAEFTAANTNCLGSTEMGETTRKGFVVLYMCSTVNTATLEVAQAGHKIGETQLIAKQADGIPTLANSAPYIVPFNGAIPVVALAGTTGTVHMTAFVYYN